MFSGADQCGFRTEGRVRQRAGDILRHAQPRGQGILEHHVVRCRRDGGLGRCRQHEPRADGITTNTLFAVLCRNILGESIARLLIVKNLEFLKNPTFCASPGLLPLYRIVPAEALFSRQD